MPREYANMRSDIWGDDDWRDLSLHAQWLYELLMTHPTLTTAGVADWRPAKLAGLAKDATVSVVREAAEELAAAWFVVFDDETEEILIRSFLRHDGVLKKPNVAISMTKAFAAVASAEIRGVIVHELLRLSVEHPEWPAWQQERVAGLLKKRSVDPKRDRSSDPSGNGYAKGSENDPSLPVTSNPLPVTGNQEASLPPRDEKKRLPEVRLPASWVPSAGHFARARELGVEVAEEVEAFRLHAETHDRHAANWNAAFTTWLKKAGERAGAGAAQLVEPVSSLTGEQILWLSARGVSREEFEERRDEPGWLEMVKKLRPKEVAHA